MGAAGNHPDGVAVRVDEEVKSGPQGYRAHASPAFRVRYAFPTGA